MAQAKGIVLPIDYYLVKDEHGMYHWYQKDPHKDKNRRENEIEIEKVISEAVGCGDIENPVMVHLKAIRIDRSAPFTVALLEQVRKGEEKHFEDRDGHVVEIIEAQNGNPKFPLNAVVLNEYGSMIKLRQYSFKGECKDGHAEHQLLVFSGPAVFETQPEEKAEPADAEQKKVDAAQQQNKD